MPGLSNLRTEIERRIAQELPSALLSRGVLYHSRKGLRDCSCTHCAAKKELSAFVRVTPSRTIEFACRPIAPEGCIERARDRRRKVARTELKQTMEHVI